MADMDQIRDQAEEKFDQVTGRALRSFLRRYRAQWSSPVQLAAAGDDPVTLGQVTSWWAEEVDEQIMAEIMAAYSGTYREVIGGTITETSMDKAREYLGRVRNRMIKDIPDSAFNRVRVATAQGLAEGWSRSRLAERVAKELGWAKNRDYWSGELSRVDRQLDEILDAAGPVGSPAREALRMNDPIVDLLQEDRSHIVSELDGDESYWQNRGNRIARTEATGATNHAAQSALQDEGWAQKEWLSSVDARTRPSHASASGQRVPVGEPFLVGGYQMMNPGDPSAPAAETVNCRCTIVGYDPPG